MPAWFCAGAAWWGLLITSRSHVWLPPFPPFRRHQRHPHGTPATPSQHPILSPPSQRAAKLWHVGFASILLNYPPGQESFSRSWIDKLPGPVFRRHVTRSTSRPRGLGEERGERDATLPKCVEENQINVRDASPRLAFWQRGSTRRAVLLSAQPVPVPQRFWTPRQAWMIEEWRKRGSDSCGFQDDFLLSMSDTNPIFIRRVFQPIHCLREWNAIYNND